MTQFHWLIAHIAPILHFRGLREDDLFRVSDLNPAPLPALWPNILPTLLVLEDVSVEFNAEIEITSAYRGTEYNEIVGGSKYSLHKKFNAIDFKVRRITPSVLGETTVEVVGPEEVASYLETLDIAPQLGVGTYETFTHLDTRGLLGRRAPARWDG